MYLILFNVKGQIKKDSVFEPWERLSFIVLGMPLIFTRFSHFLTSVYAKPISDINFMYAEVLKKGKDI